MRNISQEELNEILKKHELWVTGKGGKQADLSDVDLRCADLTYANLRCADLSNADLSDVNLRYADLRFIDLSNGNLKGADLKHAKLTYADLSKANLSKANLKGADLKHAKLTYVKLKGADLQDADLRDANLKYADLRYGNLEYADLRFANLKYANLSNVNLRDANLKYADLRYGNLEYVKTNIHTIGYNLACPKKGSFIGYKKANGCIVKLLIPEDAKRSSATTTKCRCSKAKVLDIENIETGEKVEEIRSNYDNNFIYRVGEIVYVNNFDDDRWNECATGIHFFMKKDNAIKY